MQIAVSALRKAQDNYNAKLNTAIAEATRDADLDVAQYMCQKMAENGGTSTVGVETRTTLAPPYSISYEVGVGLTADELTQGGSGVVRSGGVKFSNGGYLGGARFEGGGSSKEVTAIFSRETRICHICTTITTENCKTTGSSSWFHNSRNTSCSTETTDPICEDIQM